MFGRFQWRITVAVRDFAQMIRNAGYVGHYYDIMEMKPFISSGKKRFKLKDNSIPRIEFQNVSFSYPGTDREVLTNISFAIEPGEGLAIVGLNGAGKTTLVRLLCRIYQPTSGVILVNGVDLKDLNQTDWFSTLGILFQDYELYTQESITHNITLDLHGSDKPKEEVVRAAQMASANTFIDEYPKKYLQDIGYEYHGGVEPSKGQKQKIALARVLYRKSPIFILDEPTSAIDALSEDTIFRSLESLRQKHSIVLLSHKFSNVRGMDKIMLIEHGKILEQGNHDELMEKGGKYKELFELQAEGYR
jgi:ATP-binding cassette subfamily B protein